MKDPAAGAPEPDRERLAVLLRAHRIRPTAQRLRVAAILLARPQHLPAERVLQLANRETPMVSKATVYNTLGLFARRGLVRKVRVDPSRVFYDSNPREHHHFYDLRTGELIDIDKERIEIGDFPDLPAGARIVGIDVLVRIHGREGHS